MKLEIQKGISSFITEVFIQDSSSTTGAGLKGLQASSAGLIVAYMRSGAVGSTVATPTIINILGTFTGSATRSAITAVDATNLPGLYEFHFPNNALTNTASNCVMMLWGSNNMAPCVMEIELVGYDPNASTVNVTTGTLACNVVSWGSASVNGLISGRVDANVTTGNVAANVVQWGAASVTGVMTGALQVIATTVNDKTGYALTSAAVSANVILWGAASQNGLIGGRIDANVTTGNVSANVLQWGSASVNGVMTGSLQVIATTVNDKTSYSLTGSAVSANVVLWGAASPSGLNTGLVLGDVNKWGAASPSGLLGGGVPIASNIKKNTALSKFQFLLTDSSAHAPVTGRTNATLQRSLDGGAFAAGTLANFTEVANGTYTVDFGAGDLNGNVVMLRVSTTNTDDLFAVIVTNP